VLYSHSRLETFETCRLKFKYQYVEKPDVPKRDSVEAYLGTRVHETLEALYKNLLMSKRWTREEFLSHYEDVWQRYLSGSLYIVNRVYSLEDYFRQGYEALEKYWDRYHPFESEKTIALERRVIINLDKEGRYRLQGYIDRLSKSPDGVWQIRDYKTKRRLATQVEADADRQLALYHLGVRALWPEAADAELIWHYLLFDEEIKSVRKHTDLEKVRDDTIGLIQVVEKAIEEDDFPYTESALCDWCDFFDICPAKRHLSKIRQLPPQEFKKDDGVRLVDRLAALRRQKSSVEEQIEAVHELILAFAEQFGVDKVYGSRHRASINERTTLKVPESKDRAKRRQLEELLKTCGMWEEVSNLYGPRVVKLYESGRLPEEIQTAIGQFLSPASYRSIRLGATRDYDENFENH
jgi:putative RecB family exonuclease